MQTTEDLETRGRGSGMGTQEENAGTSWWRSG